MNQPESEKKVPAHYKFQPLSFNEPIEPDDGSYDVTCCYCLPIFHAMYLILIASIIYNLTLLYELATQFEWMKSDPMKLSYLSVFIEVVFTFLQIGVTISIIRFLVKDTIISRRLLAKSLSLMRFVIFL